MEYLDVHPIRSESKSRMAVMKAACLSVKDVSWTPRGHKKPLISSISFDLRAGRVLGIVGPNGAGKTSLLRLLYRFHRPTSGEIRLDGEDIWALSAKAVAQGVAAVLQEQPQDFALTVAEIVGLGRVPHRRGFSGAFGDHDRAVITDAIDRLKLTHLSDRHLGNLSGGERQRVMVARALAQEPQLLILDEPTNHLDIRHQLEVIDLIKALPLTIVTSLHDLNMAIGVCDEVLFLQSGHSVGFGAPSEILSESTVSSVFEVVSRRDTLSRGNKDHLTFHLQKESASL